jgi:hypothetical protein
MKRYLTIEHEMHISDVLNELDLADVLDWYEKDLGNSFVPDLVAWLEYKCIDIKDELK